MQYKIITLTGPDCVGKQTQTQLLELALLPSKRMEFPDYTHWSGHLIQAILRQEQFNLNRWVAGDQTFPISTTIWREAKDPIAFQYLQAINRRAHYDEIKQGLQSHHWVMDRYEVDSLGYGRADGAPTALVEELIGQDIPSDLVIVLYGDRYPRKGETPDINERNLALQQRVVDMYQSLSATYEDWIWMLDVANPEGLLSTAQNVYRVHRDICAMVEEGVGVKCPPLTLDYIRHFYPWLQEEPQLGLDPTL